MRQIYIGYICEGSTDKRFLLEIINSTFSEIALECRGEVSIEDVVPLKINKTSFVDTMKKASKKTLEEGLSILCIHADADKKTIIDVYNNKFTPLYSALESLDDNYCKIIVPIIPITESESWMLADKELLKQRINASDKRDDELGIEKHPESYADPKSVIENAIRIAQQNKTKRRRRELSIADLYAELGQAIKLDKLKAIPSYCEFTKSVKTAFIKLGYM
jgi:hypothetical protein